jgi:hypothetical protein
MKLKVYYHVYMINHWKKIVKEQLRLINDSGLYDAMDIMSVVAVGEPIDQLREITDKYDKIKIVDHSFNPKVYEFPTLDIAHLDANYLEPFYGLYLHTKGVTQPGKSGGKFWRDYMGYYNVATWSEAVDKLKEGYDTCGVRLVSGRYPLHYSGNFFWFRSTYLRRLPSPLTLNIRDRYNAEFWSCSGNGKAATLCQDLIDYNTKGLFYKGENYVHTLAYNLPSQVEGATKLLYQQNDNFKHYIVDLGYPIVKAGVVPDNIQKSKKINSEKLKEIAAKYGSKYVKMPNKGVTRNWDAFVKYINPYDEDIIIGADPDERPLNDGWVNAMSKVTREGYGLVTLMMPDHLDWKRQAGRMNKQSVIVVNGIKILKNFENINWGLIGISGKFFNEYGGMPLAPGIYGWMERTVNAELKRLNHDYAILTDYLVKHTDYEYGDKGTDDLLREWKNLIIFQIKKYGQITFDEFLMRRKRGEL